MKYYKKIGDIELRNDDNKMTPILVTSDEKNKLLRKSVSMLDKYAFNNFSINYCDLLRNAQIILFNLDEIKADLQVEDILLNDLFDRKQDVQMPYENFVVLNTFDSISENIIKKYNLEEQYSAVESEKMSTYSQNVIIAVHVVKREKYYHMHLFSLDYVQNTVFYEISIEGENLSFNIESKRLSMEIERFWVNGVTPESNALMNKEELEPIKHRLHIEANHNKTNYADFPLSAAIVAVNDSVFDNKLILKEIFDKSFHRALEYLHDNILLMSNNILLPLKESLILTDKQKKKIEKSKKNGRLNMVPRDEILHLMPVFKVEQLRHSVGLSSGDRKLPVPHRRKGHWRTLYRDSEKERDIWVRPSFIGKKEFADKRAMYQVIV